MADEKLRIRLPAGTLEGGEIESADTCSYGSYAASIKAVDAPSSIIGFFLYAAPDFHTEIDVEIFNDERTLLPRCGRRGESHCRARQAPGRPSKVYNIGSTEEVSVRELVERIKIMTGSSSEIVLVPYSKAYQNPGFEDMERRKPDTRRVNALRGRSSENTLEDILERVIS